MHLGLELVSDDEVLAIDALLPATAVRQRKLLSHVVKVISEVRSSRLLNTRENPFRPSPSQLLADNLTETAGQESTPSSGGGH